MNGERRYKQPNFILFMVDSILFPLIPFSLIPLNVICVTHGREKNLALPLTTILAEID